MKLFKIIILIFLGLVCSIYSISLGFSAWNDPNEDLYTNNEGNSVSMDSDSLKSGANRASRGIEGTSGNLSGDHAKSTMDYISRWISYFLGILAIIVLVLLVYNGIAMITAGGDEERYSNGLKNLRNYAIGLIFIGLAWLFVMLIFYIIKGFFYTGV